MMNFWAKSIVTTIVGQSIFVEKTNLNSLSSSVQYSDLISLRFCHDLAKPAGFLYKSFKCPKNGSPLLGGPGISSNDFNFFNLTLEQVLFENITTLFLTNICGVLGVYIVSCYSAVTAK